MIFEETLYGQTKNGGTYVWNIKVEDDNTLGLIIITRGQLDGKMTSTSKIISKGKNIGKINETTPLQQAVLEAESKRNQKLDDGYAYTIEESRAKFQNLLKPMLADVYDRHWKKIKYPCFAQPKLDGIRCLARRQGDKVTLFSRKGKVLDLVPHINGALLQVLADGQCADGELYVHGWDFQRIISAVKKTSIDTREVQYHIYDMPDMQDRTKTFVERFNTSHKNIIEAAHNCLVPVATKLIRDVDELMAYEEVSIANSYEGIMARNSGSLYLFGYRSTDLLKVKRFQDAEYLVRGYTHGTSIEKDCLIFICETPGGKEFKVRPIGTHEERKTMFTKGSSYIGKMLTVKFQELSLDGVPRFPVGLHIREEWDMS